MSSSRFEYRGDLATTPLAEVLQTVHRYKVPGVVRLAREGTEKKVFIWRGDVIFATSSDIEDSLGRYLFRHGLIKPAQLFESVKRLNVGEGRKRHGEILVEMGLLTETSLRTVVVEQVKEMVTGLFGWDAGEVTFHVGEQRTEEAIQLKIATRHMILEGIKAIQDVRRLVSSLGPSWTVFCPTFAPTEIADIGLAPSEVEYLGRIDGARTLRELVGAGPGDAGHNAKLIYTFHILKLISKRDPDSGGIKRIQWRSPGGGFQAGG